MSKEKDYNLKAVLAKVQAKTEPLTLARLITADIGADRWDEAMKVFNSLKSGTVH